MNKKSILTSMLLIGATSLLAGNITQKQADDIVLNYVKSEALKPAALYNYGKTPDGEGVGIKTSNDEEFRAKYACWAYCLEESEPAQRRYLFVKEEGGSLLEVIASNDESVLDEESWAAMDLTGLPANKANSHKLLYPNPVGDVLTIPCGDNARVEIYDLKGTRLFSGQLSGENNCRLNVSFLGAGVYTVNVSGEMFKMIKK